MSEIEASTPFRRSIRPIEEADFNLALARARRSLTIFIAGPYIEKGWSQEQRDSKPKSAILRISILEHIENDLKHTAVLGEHRGVLEAGEVRLRSRSSPLVTEIALVQSADAIVIIPSSPGSFCELGSWVVHEDICRKMLILADASYKDGGGYVSLGVFKTAVDHGSRLIWVDYSNIDDSMAQIDDFVGRVEDAVLSRSILNGSAR